MANTNNTYTLKTNPSKYANLHTCDQKYWKFTADWSQPQDVQTLTKSLEFVTNRLGNIVKAKAFKAENIKSAKELLAVVKTVVDEIVTDAKAGTLDLKVESFKVYQLERFMFRLWYRDTKAARDATEPKAPKVKAEKPAQPKADAKAKSKSTKAKSTDDALDASKMTKAQKKALVLALMAELLK